jgi:hypothetical protein
MLMNLSRLVSIAKSKTRSCQGGSKRHQTSSSSQSISNSIWEDAFEKAADYVERLRNMVSRHLTLPYKFVCLTDDSTPIEGVELLVQPNAGYARPWWHKVHMFDPNLGLEGKILYLDLPMFEEKSRALPEPTV